MRHYSPSFGVLNGFCTAGWALDNRESMSWARSSRRRLRSNRSDRQAAQPVKSRLVMEITATIATESLEW